MSCSQIGNCFPNTYIAYAPGFNSADPPSEVIMHSAKISGLCAGTNVNTACGPPDKGPSCAMLTPQVKHKIAPPAWVPAGVRKVLLIGAPLAGWSYKSIREITANVTGGDGSGTNIGDGLYSFTGATDGYMPAMGKWDALFLDFRTGAFIADPPITQPVALAETLANGIYQLNRGIHKDRQSLNATGEVTAGLGIMLPYLAPAGAWPWADCSANWGPGSIMPGGASMVVPVEYVVCTDDTATPFSPQLTSWLSNYWLQGNPVPFVVTPGPTPTLPQQGKGTWPNGGNGPAQQGSSGYFSIAVPVNTQADSATLTGQQPTSALLASDEGAVAVLQTAPPGPSGSAQGPSLACYGMSIAAPVNTNTQTAVPPACCVPKISEVDPDYEAYSY